MQKDTSLGNGSPDYLASCPLQRVEFATLYEAMPPLVRAHFTLALKNADKNLRRQKYKGTLLMSLLRSYLTPKVAEKYQLRSLPAVFTDELKRFLPLTGIHSDTWPSFEEVVAHWGQISAPFEYLAHGDHPQLQAA